MDSPVEVFGTGDDDGEGEIYLGSVETDAAGWFALETGWSLYSYLTATATDLTDGTSEFSAPFANPFRGSFLPMVLNR